MLKLEEWLVKVKIKFMVKEKRLLRRQANGYQSIREIHQLNSETSPGDINNENRIRMGFKC